MGKKYVKVPFAVAEKCWNYLSTTNDPNRNDDYGLKSKYQVWEVPLDKPPIGWCPDGLSLTGWMSNKHNDLYVHQAVLAEVLLDLLQRA